MFTGGTGFLPVAKWVSVWVALQQPLSEDATIRFIQSTAGHYKETLEVLQVAKEQASEPQM